MIILKTIMTSIDMRIMRLFEKAYRNIL